MAGTERRKCKCCQKLFRPDPLIRHHQILRRAELSRGKQGSAVFSKNADE
jgi:hypothetical protein